MGLVDGCTTNLSPIAKEKRPIRPLLEEICSIVPGDVSLEVVATDVEGMIKEGRELAQIAKNVVVKCPVIKGGLMAIKHLSGEGIRGNHTLCFSAPQALLSAKAGAVYISPFLGRLDDIGDVGRCYRCLAHQPTVAHHPAQAVTLFRVSLLGCTPWKLAF